MLSCYPDIDDMKLQKVVRLTVECRQCTKTESVVGDENISTKDAALEVLYRRGWRHVITDNEIIANACSQCVAELEQIEGEKNKEELV